MTDDDELMSLDDALRIILKVPEQEPCDDRPTADGDDQVEPDEESDL